MTRNIKIIDKIINDLEERAIELASVGEDERAEQSKLLASKYKEMKYNGHLTVYNKGRKI
tara:strand:- start:38 stop:217 length:180 start_codon:yes stop_codon:yes gene_type:complete